MDDIERIDREIADWERVLTAYEYGTGRTMYESKDERCGLCPTYQHRVVNVATGAAILTCRRCPVVRATGRTCAAWRHEYGWPLDWHTDERRAVVGVLLIIYRLNTVKQWLIREK